MARLPDETAVLNAIVRANLDVSFILINQTLVPVVTLTAQETDENVSVNGSIAFLSLFLIASLAANAGVVVTVCLSSVLKRSAVYQLLACLCGTCLTDAGANISLSIAYVRLGHWTMPAALCSANSFTTLFTSAVLCSIVACLAVERYLFYKDPYEHTNRMGNAINYFSIGCLISWIALAALYAPLAVPSFVQTIAFPRRYACGPNGNYRVVYMIVLLLSSHIFPLTVLLISLLRMGRIYYDQKRATERIRVTGDQRDSKSLKSAALLLQESSNIVLVLIITAAYVVLALPHALAVHQFDVSHPPMPANTSAYQDFVASLALTTEEKLIIDKHDSELRAVFEAVHREAADTIPTVKEVQEGSSLTILIWLRYAFDVMVPVLIFYTQSDVRAKALAFIRRGIERQASEAILRDDAYAHSGDLQHVELTFSKSLMARTPVLFVTDGGLFLRQWDETANTALPAGEKFKFVYMDVGPPVLVHSEKADDREDQRRAEIDQLQQLGWKTEHVQDARDQSRKAVKFSPMAEEIDQRSDGFWINQLKDYYGARGVVLVTDGVAIDKAEKSAGQHPRPSVRAISPTVAKKRMFRGNPTLPNSGPMITGRPSDLIRPPWRF